MTLDEITLHDFAACVGQKFSVNLALPKPLELDLLSAAPLAGPAVAGKRESFKLLFRAAPEWHCPQQIYPLAHPALGELGVFLVPVGKNTQGTELEAIFRFV
jgi:hypothetical protein